MSAPTLHPTKLIRYGRLARFETPDATTYVDFPRLESEWESDQPVQTSISSIAGANYGYDAFGRGSSPLNPATERWRCLVPREDIDHMRATTHRIGHGRLWMEHYDRFYRWSWARLNEVPGFSLTMPPMQYVPMVFPFTRLSDWYDAEATVVEQQVSGGATIGIDNDGSMTSRNVVITVTANSAGGWSNPTIQNSTSNETFTVNRTASSEEILRIDVLNFRAERSTDGGATWIDTTQNMFLANSQVSPISLLPGGNVLNVSGMNEATIEIEFYGAWL